MEINDLGLRFVSEKKFQKASKELSHSTRDKIRDILKKNEKKTK